MTDRVEIENLLRGLYGSRARGDLDGVCATFADDAKFNIAGASHHSSPIAIAAAGIREIRAWLALMTKTFQLDDQRILSMIIDGQKAAVHWRANIYSRVTGLAVMTELVDVIELEDGLIASYTEFFVPRQSEPRDPGRPA